MSVTDRCRGYRNPTAPESAPLFEQQESAIMQTLIDHMQLGHYCELKDGTIGISNSRDEIYVRLRG